MKKGTKNVICMAAFLVAIAGVYAFCKCDNATDFSRTDEPVDTMAVDSAVVDTMAVDSVVVDTLK